MTEEVQIKPPKADNRMLIAAVVLVGVGTALSYYFMKKWQCPCHSTGEEPIIQVAKASAEMSSSPAEDLPEEPRTTAPGGNSLSLNGTNSFVPRETQLPPEPARRRRTK